MNCKIANVMVFTENKVKNEVPFNGGLNIISGVSQTGKSAIIEIIDYCLASSTSSIPKGVIVDNSILYSIILEINDKYIILGRRPYHYSKKNECGRSKMFLKAEPKKYFNKDKICYRYFDENRACYRPLDDVKKDIEKFLGIAAYKQSIYEGGEIKNERVSIRNITSFLFQHQNLVANKFALFYRFDDSFKRKKTIMEFPVFLGLVDQEYYNLLQNRDIKLKELKRLEREKRLDEEYNAEILSRIEYDIKEYYKFICKKINDEYIKDIISSKRDVDKLSIEEIDIEESLKYYNKLEDDLRRINSEIYILQNEINNIDITLNSGADVEKIINDANRDKKIVLDNYISICPFCSSKVEEINDKITKVNECKKVLNDSLESISVIKKEYLQLEKRRIKERLNTYKKSQENLRKEIKEIKLNHKSIEDKLEFKDLIIEKRVRIELDLKRLSLSKKEKYESIENLNDEILYLGEQLDGYDLNKELNKIEIIINDFMNKIAEKLDFEERYNPINLKFDAETFDLYQYQDREKIFLSNMGSGSNWLTCHLALFLGLHFCFAELGDKCSIPSILIIDQPSQIYFPNISDKKKDIDIISVENIYKALKWAIGYIEKKTGQKIQIIALDHVAGLNFEDEEFDDFIIKRWNEKGNGLIYKENIIK